MAEESLEERRQKGRDLIARIRKKVGALPAERIEAMRIADPETLESLQSVRRMLSETMKGVITDLYSKDTRFVYELIQNAEDNRYSRITSQGQRPFLKFSLYSDRLVMDTNEDGFSEKDVQAICDANGSTKKHQHGYIGEKGVGFKSVFRIAKKVHIQSEPYSFSFSYSRDSPDDNDGLGMVTPIQEEYYQLPENVQTRFTFTLIANSDFSKRVDDLNDIPDSLLLFLIKLRKLRLKIHHPSGDVTEVIYSYRRDENRNLDVIVREELSNGELESERESLFRVTKRVITKLPPDEKRKGIDEATVILAFPVDKKGYPILESQHVFAYLPLRHMGFQFLIQSDFVTQPSREGVSDSSRNKALLEGVAETFRDAVLSFCKDDTMRYRWMRYLPPKSVADEFWGKLRDLIIDKLKNEPIVRSRKGNFYRPSQLSWIPLEYEHYERSPLFPDLDQEIYMDSDYSHQDFELLKPLGSTVIKWNDLIDRLENDLNRSDSKMRSPYTDDPVWYERVATLLSRPFANSQRGPKSQEVCGRLRSLPLVPLRGGKWASGLSEIYFPSAGHGEIPADLDQNYVCPKLLEHASDATLERFFSFLGVKKCNIKQVLQWIRQRYDQPLLESLTIENSIQHLRYLFWNLPEEESLGFDIRVVGSGGALMRPGEIYLPDAFDPYSAENLFDPLDGTTERYPAKFLPIKYLQAVPNTMRHHGRSWSDWLEKVVGITPIPRMTCETGLTEEFRYIMTNRVHSLVGLLRKHWSQYESLIPSVSDELRACMVGSQILFHPIPLENSYFPLPRLKNMVKEVPWNGLLFIRIRTRAKIVDEDEGKWIFLKQVGVRFSDDLDFYMMALGLIVARGQSREAIEMSVFNVYNGLTRNWSTDDDATRIRDFFKKGKKVFIPGPGHTQHVWQKLSSCVWDGPAWLESTPSLSTRSKYANVRQLFQTILQLRNSNWADGINELKSMQAQRVKDRRKAEEIYTYLSNDTATKEDNDTIRAELEEHDLVYVPLQEAWVPPSACIWADDSIQIPRKHSISINYAPLEDFFHNTLGVKRPDVPMLVNAVQEMSTLQPPPVDQLKDIFMAISEMTPANEDLMRLRFTNFLPVQLLNGRTKLVKPSADFSVVDRTGYGEAFEGKAVLLNLTPTEVHSCRSLLVGLGLQDRLISKAVEEITTAGRGIANPGLTRNFQWKAYALFRCAVHFSSRKVRGKDRSLLELLQAATVHVSHHISKSLRLMQGPSVYTVENLQANFHMDVIDGRLMLYVPAEKQKMEACYLEELPKHVFNFFEISNQAAEAVLIKIIGSSSFEMVDNILEKAGIVEVQGVGRPVDGDILGARLGTDSVFDAQTQQPPDRGNRARSIPRQNSRTHMDANDVDLTYSQPNEADPIIDILSARQRTLSTHSPDPQIIESIEQPVENTAYATLLERLIRTARNAYLPLSDTPSHCFCSRTSTLPTFNCADHHTTYPSIFNFRSLDRDRKVGAAGELFAFEILNHLNLPRFSATANWLSTLRKEARACAAHAALEPWHGAETSDIVYHDAAGALTAELREKGYFGADAVVERPTYYIEVKTTTRGCEEPLFMSGAQYLRMQRMALVPGTPAAEVYVLVRVFKLEREDVGLRVYVDPERYKRAGVLAFNVDTWIVKPDNSQPFPERTIVLD